MLTLKQKMLRKYYFQHAVALEGDKKIPPSLTHYRALFNAATELVASREKLKEIKLDTSELCDFLSSKNRNAWLEVGVLQFYARKARRNHNDIAINTFEIANITVAAPNRGKGAFKNLLSILPDILLHYRDITHIYVENVLNEKLEHYLIASGFTKASYGIFDGLETTFSYLKKIKE